MNWYLLFYWLTVADGIKSFFDVASNIFTGFAIVSFAVFIISWWAYVDLKSNKDEENDTVKSAKTWLKNSRASFIVFLIFAMLTWTGYVAIPSKKDALIIIAGGAVGNFITSDSSARVLPAEVMNLLREKVKTEIHELKLEQIISKTPEEMTKEELLEYIKTQEVKQ